MNAPTIADYAASYVSQLGMRLVPLPPREKRPLAKDWGEKLLDHPDRARTFFLQNPDWNVGVALGPSRVCSFDVDDYEATRAICDEFGWDLDGLLAQHPTCQGQPPGVRVMFRVPDGVQLDYHALTWPNKDKPGRVTVFELRAADTQQRQDVLPPSIHPATGQPYTWLTRPVASQGLPEPPQWLLALWSNWAALKPQLEAVCPWSKPERPVAVRPREHRGDSVIDAYDRAHSITEQLARYGYRQQGKRWLSPHSQTGLAGVVVWPDDNRAWIHHASDPLCSDASGQPVAPFDLFAAYEHQGDLSKAARDAAQQLGMVRPSRPERIDPETGEITTVDVGQQPLLAPLPDTTDRGKVLATIENFQEIVRRLNVTIRYNVISKDEEILIPSASFSIDNRANASLAWLISWCARFRMPTDKVSDFVTYLADQNQYNPAATWILSRPWDGQSRLQALYDSIQSSSPAQLKEVLMRRWLISAVAAAFEPEGVSAHGVLVLQGAQYLGKTKWFKSLVPANTRLAQDGMMLRPEDRDSVKQACSFWLVELGELDATFRKTDIAQLKAFLTRDRDVLRRAYAKRESEYARRTVFFASVNPREFLHDATGNRRYWVIECESINHDHGIDMQQLWAEVHQIYDRGESWFLAPDEMAQLNEANQEFEVRDPIEDRISSRLDWTTDESTWRWMTVTDILIEMGVDRPARGDINTAGQMIRKLNRGQGRKTNGVRQLRVPPQAWQGPKGHG
jgi:hypothetical protein